MKTYHLFITENVTEEMLQQFHAQSSVGNLKPVAVEDLLLIPDLQWEDAEELPSKRKGEKDSDYLVRAKVRTRAQVKAKAKKGLKVGGKKRLQALKDKFKWNQEQNLGKTKSKTNASIV